MIFDPEVVRRRDLKDCFRGRRALHIFNAPALPADEVIVPIRSTVVLRHAADTQLPDQSLFHQMGERSVDGRLSHARQNLTCALEDLGRRRVIRRPQDQIKDDLSLLGSLHSGASDENSCRRPNAPPRTIHRLVAAIGRGSG